MSTYQRTGKRIFFFTVFFMAVLLFAGKGNVQAKRKSVALNKTTVTAYKGMAPVKLKVKNVKKGKNIIWFSSKSSVAEVSQDGTVTFHKKGNAIVQAKVGKKTLKCIVSVCSKKAYKAVEKAKKFHSARNMSYSQGNRMGKRSADCSSFCGRCYLPQGITMGGSTSWCNTCSFLLNCTSLKPSASISELQKVKKFLWSSAVVIVLPALDNTLRTPALICASSDALVVSNVR